MFVEFLNTWHHILNDQPTERIAELLIKAVRAYLSNASTKGCIMWDKASKQCTIHHTRPLNCRLYSQIPDEEFKPRFDRLKVLYEKSPDAVIMEQCNLTETVGDEPSMADTDRWQRELERIEQDVGIPKALINDNEGGSYRTFQDHILLRMCGQPFLARLTVLKLTASKEEQERFIQDLIEKMRVAHPALKDTRDTEASSKIVIAES
jgi:Fe-S-cluster containining protein